VMAARNEAGYIETTLRALIAEGMEVALLDHGSIDGTRERAEAFLGRGLISISDLPWHGTFDLTEQLTAKAAVYRQARHDWLMHVDADEWPRSTQDAPLAEFLEHEVTAHHAVVNFREFVFVPPTGADLFAQDFRRLATRYYCFEPRPRRLMRAWRRGAVPDTVLGAGHDFPGLDPSLVYPEDQTLRHYIGLSWSHAISRRANRVYAPGDLAQGWHANRLDMRTAPDLGASVFRTADPWDTRSLDASAPSRHHFWEPGFSGGSRMAATRGAR
jgi:Glycosyl transferase family 2